ncbi:hypothetical protein ACMDCR_25275 [Labrys okinawensis]|uniref:hypothetical protein n=1 Tax=Labrys okinawensis TaxID=346911 RepID=UPI0039BD6325
MRYLPTALALATLLAAPSLAYADCTADFAAVMQAYHDAGPRKVETELTFTTSKPGESSTRTSVAKIVLPDALDLHSEDSGNRNHSDAILIGGKGFTKVDGGWTALPAEAVGELRMLFLADGFMGEEPRNIQCLGGKKLGHKPVSVYSFEIPGSPKAMTVMFYVDTSTKRPLKANGIAAMQAGGEDMKVSYTYDPKIKVVAPN